MGKLKVIEEAMMAFDNGDMEQGQMLLKEQADQMLVMRLHQQPAYGGRIGKTI